MDGEDSRGAPSSGYLLMEDGAGLEGRCMTMPQLHSSLRSSEETAPRDSQRTATFIASTLGTAAGEAVDTLPALREFTPRQPAARRTGILRQSTSLDITSGESEVPQRRRTKKQVCITLPGSSGPVVSSRRQECVHNNPAELPTGDALSVHRQEAVVEVEVHENSNTSRAGKREIIMQD